MTTDFHLVQSRPVSLALGFGADFRLCKHPRPATVTAFDKEGCSLRQYYQLVRICTLGYSSAVYGRFSRSVSRPMIVYRRSRKECAEQGSVMCTGCPLIPTSVAGNHVDAPTKASRMKPARIAIL